MNFSLDGGWMLAIVVLLWLLVYVPNWGRRDESKIQGSSSGRNFSKQPRFEAKNARNGVSDLINIDKNLLVVRRIFTALLVVAFATVVFSLFKVVENLSWLVLTVSAAVVFLTAASTLRSSRKKLVQKPALTMEQLEAQRARMAYFTWERALPDAPAELLFDERAWTQTLVPESNLTRRIGELEEVNLATVSNIDSVQADRAQKKLNAAELDRILQRRRAI